MIKYPPCSNDFQFLFNFHHKISPETAGNKMNNKNGTKKKKKKKNYNVPVNSCCKIEDITIMFM